MRTEVKVKYCFLEPRGEQDLNFQETLILKLT